MGEFIYDLSGGNHTMSASEAAKAIWRFTASNGEIAVITVPAPTSDANAYWRDVVTDFTVTEAGSPSMTLKTSVAATGTVAFGGPSPANVSMCVAVDNTNGITQVGAALIE